MHVISRKALREFWEQHPQAEMPLPAWYDIARHATWQSITEVRRDFPHADAAGVCTVFNISGNNYRLVTKIFYVEQTILVRFVLTHAGYDKEKWKNDCGC